jgi:hypothetical protein
LVSFLFRGGWNQRCLQATAHRPNQTRHLSLDGFWAKNVFYVFFVGVGTRVLTYTC